MTEKRKRCGAVEPGKPNYRSAPDKKYHPYVERIQDGGCSENCKPCPGCHSCRPDLWCEHDLELCKEASDSICNIGHGQWGSHHADGTVCVPVTVNLPFERIPQHKDDPGFGEVSPETNISELRLKPKEFTKCPTCGSKDGEPLWKSEIETYHADNSGWHKYTTGCQSAAAWRPYPGTICHPCPTCSAKKEAKYQRPVWGLEQVGGPDRWVATCPVHGANPCTTPCNLIGHYRGNVSHFECGCLQEQGSGDVQNRDRPAKIHGTGANASGNPSDCADSPMLGTSSPDLSPLFAEVAEEIVAEKHKLNVDVPYESEEGLIAAILSRRFGPVVENAKIVVQAAVFVAGTGLCPVCGHKRHQKGCQMGLLREALAGLEKP